MKWRFDHILINARSKWFNFEQMRRGRTSNLTTSDINEPQVILAGPPTQGESPIASSTSEDRHSNFMIPIAGPSHDRSPAFGKKSAGNTISPILRHHRWYPSPRKNKGPKHITTDLDRPSALSSSKFIALLKDVREQKKSREEEKERKRVIRENKKKNPTTMGTLGKKRKGKVTGNAAQKFIKTSTTEASRQRQQTTMSASGSSESDDVSSMVLMSESESEDFTVEGEITGEALVMPSEEPTENSWVAVRFEKPATTSRGRSLMKKYEIFFGRVTQRSEEEGIADKETIYTVSFVKLVQTSGLVQTGGYYIWPEKKDISVCRREELVCIAPPTYKDFGRTEGILFKDMTLESALAVLKV